MNAFSKANYPLQLFTTGTMQQQQQQKVKGTVSKKDNPADIFIIHHTAGSVVYNINGFRDKNMDRLNDDLHTLISHTTNGVLKEAVTVTSLTTSSSEGQGVGVGGSRRSYIAQKFVQSIDSLMTMLDPTEAFFVRCVKPNPQKKPRLYSNRSVMRQLHSLSVFHAIKMSSCGYCFRLPFRQFLYRYHPLSFLKDNSHTYTTEGDMALLMADGSNDNDKQEECSVFLKKFLGGRSGEGAVIGKTMVLARKECHMLLEKSLNWVLSDILKPIALTIRKTMNQKIAVEKYTIRNGRLILIQSMLRSYLIRRTEMQRIQLRRGLITVALLQRKVYMFLVARAAAMQLQTAARNLLGMLIYERRCKNLHLMNASSILQSYGRAVLSRVRFQCRRENREKDKAARLIQGAMRKAYTRRAYAKNWTWRMLVWPIRRYYQTKVHATLIIQSVWRAHLVRQQNVMVLMKIREAREGVLRKAKVEEAKRVLIAVIQGYVVRATIARYHHTAIIIQARIRDILRPLTMRLHLLSSIKIQSLWRGYVVRVLIAMVKAKVVLSGAYTRSNPHRMDNRCLWLTLLLEQYRTNQYTGLTLIHPPEGREHEEIHHLIRGFRTTWRLHGPLLHLAEFCSGYLGIIHSSSSSPCIVTWGTHDGGEVVVSRIPPLLPYTKVETISCGIEHALLLLVGGNPTRHIILALGSNKRGQCGVPKERTILSTPEPILTLNDSIITPCISAGPYHSLCTVVCYQDIVSTMAWGAYDGICLPSQFPIDTFIPSPIELLTTLGLNRVYATNGGNLGITLDGSLVAWSIPSHIHFRKMLGKTHDDGIYSSPKVILSLPNTPILTLNTDGNRIILLTNDGSLYYWGRMMIRCIYGTMVIGGSSSSSYSSSITSSLLSTPPSTPPIDEYNIVHHPVRVDLSEYHYPVMEVHLCSDGHYGDRVVIRLIDGTLLGWDTVTYDNTGEVPLLRPGLFQYRHASNVEAARVMPTGTVVGMLSPKTRTYHLRSLKRAVSGIEPGPKDGRSRIHPLKKSVCDIPAIRTVVGNHARTNLVLQDAVGGRVPLRDR